MKTIAILIHTKVILNNFVTSGAFHELNKNFKCVFLAPELVRESLDSQSYFYSSSINEDRFVAKIRFHLDFLSMKRYESRSSTFPIKFHSLYFKNLSPIKKLLVNALSVPFIYEFIAGTFEFCCGCEKIFLDLNLIFYPVELWGY